MDKILSFDEKYTTDVLSKDQIIISKDAYAIGEMIQNLINKIEVARLTLK